MGSQSDYQVMKNCEEILKILKIKYETKIISAMAKKWNYGCKNCGKK